MRGHAVLPICLLAACGQSGGVAESCSCNDAGQYDDKDCFCEGLGLGCSDHVTIERVVEPTCPGAMIHPISASCKIGGVVIEDEFMTERFYYDRDSWELVGISISTDTESYCDSTQYTVTWGNVTPSCELCDPCGDDGTLPACPEPEAP